MTRAGMRKLVPENMVSRYLNDGYEKVEAPKAVTPKATPKKNTTKKQAVAEETVTTEPAE